MEALTRADLIVSHPSAPLSGAAGPCYRRLDCAVPGIVAVWATLVEFGRKFILEDVTRVLPAPPARMFDSEADAVGWIVDKVNGDAALSARVKDVLARAKAEPEATVETPYDERGTWS